MSQKRRKKISRKEVEGSLFAQINPTGASEQKHFLNLINDYMAMWDVKEQLIEDIRGRGAVVPYTSNSGAVNMKKNDSIDQLLKVNAQMLKILSDLGLRPLIEGAEDEL